MGGLKNTWASHVLSLLVILAFGLMSLSCLELENLDPFEAAILWALPQDSVECTTIDAETGPRHCHFEVRDAITGQFLGGVAIDVTFTFHAYEWTGEWDDDGNPLCLKEVALSTEKASVVTDAGGWTDNVSSPPVVWDDENDIMVISYVASKVGYTSASGTLTSTYKGPYGFTVRPRLASIDN